MRPAAHEELVELVLDALGDVLRAGHDQRLDVGGDGGAAAGEVDRAHLVLLVEELLDLGVVLLERPLLVAGEETDGRLPALAGDLEDRGGQVVLQRVVVLDERDRLDLVAVLHADPEEDVGHLELVLGQLARLNLGDAHRLGLLRQLRLLRRVDDPDLQLAARVGLVLAQHVGDPVAQRRHLRRQLARR